MQYWYEIFNNLFTNRNAYTNVFLEKDGVTLLVIYFIGA